MTLIASKLSVKTNNSFSLLYGYSRFQDAQDTLTK